MRLGNLAQEARILALSPTLVHYPTSKMGAHRSGSVVDRVVEVAEGRIVPAALARYRRWRSRASRGIEYLPSRRLFP